MIRSCSGLRAIVTASRMICRPRLARYAVYGRLLIVIDRIEERHSYVPNPALQRALWPQRSPPGTPPDPLHQIPVAIEGQERRSGDSECFGDAPPVFRVNADEQIGPLHRQQTRGRPPSCPLPFVTSCERIEATLANDPFDRDVVESGIQARPIIVQALLEVSVTPHAAGPARIPRRSADKLPLDDRHFGETPVLDEECQATLSRLGSGSV